MDNDTRRALLEAIERNTDAVKKQTAAIERQTDILQEEAVRQRKNNEERNTLLATQTKLLMTLVLCKILLGTRSLSFEDVAAEVSKARKALKALDYDVHEFDFILRRIGL